MNKYQVLEDRLLVRPIKETEIKLTDGGIYDPNVRKKPVAEGIVISIGEGRRANDNGDLMATVLHEGDKILYPTNQETFITIETENGKEEVLLMRESDVIMVISKKTDSL